MNAKQKLFSKMSHAKKVAVMLANGQDMECTFFPEGPWSPCCWAHDEMCYWVSLIEDRAERVAARKEGDGEFKECIQKRGFHKIGNLAYAGVRGYARWRKWKGID